MAVIRQLSHNFKRPVVSPNKAFLLLLALFALAMVSILQLLVKTAPLTMARAVYFCQKAFALPISTEIHALPLIASFGILLLILIGVVSALIQILHSRQIVKRYLVKQIPIPHSVQAIATGLGLCDKVVIVKHNKKLSFCFGMIQPKICLSTGLLRTLTTDELKAVLLHESYHVKNHDPLKILLSKTARLMLFFIPTVKEMHQYYVLSKEIAADATAVRMGKRQSLKQVLAKLLESNQPQLGIVAALANTDDLEKRILHLTNQRYLEPLRLSLANLAISFGVFVAMFFMLQAPVHAMTTDMPMSPQSVFVCPFASSCTAACQQKTRTMQQSAQGTENIMSINLLYTPVLGETK